MKPEALIDFKRNADELEIVGSGSWTAANAGRLDAMIDAEPLHRTSRVKIDMSGVREFDTYGAWLLERLSRDFGGWGGLPQTGLPDRFRDLFDKVHETNRRSPPTRDHGNWLLGRLEHMGRRVDGAAEDTVRHLSVVGAFVTVLIQILLAPRRTRFTCSSINSIGWAFGRFRS